MKDIFAAFGNEVFRPLVTLLLPGAVAISTWLAILIDRYPGLRKFGSEYSTEASLLLLCAALFAGMVIEDFGSRLESRFDVLLNKQTKGALAQAWSGYLRVAFKTEPVAEKYLTTLVLRLKFELSGVFGLLIAAVGFLFLPPGTAGHRGLAALVATGLAFYLAMEAKATHRVLHQVRMEILGVITVIG